MYGHVHYVDGVSTVLGVPVAPRFAWGFHVPLGRGKKHAVGGRAPLMTPQGLGRGGEISPETPIVPEASSQGLGEIEFAVCTFERLTRC
jgi:hypothetical protein